MHVNGIPVEQIPVSLEFQWNIPVTGIPLNPGHVTGHMTDHMTCNLKTTRRKQNGEESDIQSEEISNFRCHILLSLSGHSFYVSTL